ncbi:unnamed protein product, partial [Iphiclides podalirius]
MNTVFKYPTRAYYSALTRGYSNAHYDSGRLYKRAVAGRGSSVAYGDASASRGTSRTDGLIGNAQANRSALSCMNAFWSLHSP